MASRATRDLGLERIATSTRFLAVGALVAGGVLSAAVAKALPGKSTSHATSIPAPGHHSRRGHDDGGGGQIASGSSLNPPVQAPQPVTAPPVVSSGAS